jgi:Protein of unknown function (DUF2950)
MRHLIASCLILPVSLLAVGCQSRQETFATPQAAVDRLAAATVAQDGHAIKAILGEQVGELGSGNAEQDALDFQRFAAAMAREHTLNVRPDGTQVLQVGGTGWTFPAPLVSDGKRWRFDTAAGVEEMLNRRVGDNELATIAACRYIVEAELAYFAADPDNDSVKSYAARIVSTEGRHDGLYWPSEPGQPESPLGPRITAAVASGNLRPDSRHSGYKGYHYHILKSAGPDAPGGARPYVDANGRMTGGFAVIAWPADYSRSGVMSFLVGPDGVVYEADLGPDTAATAKAIEAYNPDAQWKPVQDSDSRSVTPVASPPDANK